jgi:hypothetical protein
MSVNLVISGSSGGNDLAEQTSLGSHSPGSDTDTQDWYISHDGLNEITDVSLYAMRDVSPSYPGLDADADIATLLSWGTAVSTEGIQINMNASGASWQPMKNGSGDQANPITLDDASIVVGTAVGDGIIPANGEAKVQFKVVLPSSGTTAGTMGFSVVTAYSSTS